MRATVLLPLVLLAGCGSAPDYSGSYTIGLTNQGNACALQNWAPGAMTSGVSLVINDDSGKLTGVVGGPVQTYAQYISKPTGAPLVFTGHSDGMLFSMSLYGNQSFTQGSCVYTITATMSGNLAGDLLTGTVDYAASTNGSPDCGAISNCHSTQAFNGTRPPR